MFPVAQFNSFVKANKLFTPQSKLLVAVSGGMDSVYLVHLLSAAGYNFGIAHCNFLLRGEESLQDQQFCHLLAKQFNVPFFHTSFNTETYAAQNKISIQMAARDLRYKWFEDISQQNGYDVIALAHHQNDTVETILLNFTRGTGVAGLHGIKPKNGKLVRPLLFLTREEIIAGIKENNIVYREDSSNSSLKYARNKIRHQVIPALKELNPDLEQTFINEAQYFTELEQLLQSQVEKLKNQLFIYRGDEVLLEIAKITVLKPQQLLLQGLLEPYGFSATTVADIISSLDKHAGRIFFSTSHKLLLDREQLIISPADDESAEPVRIAQTDSNVIFGKYCISISSAIENFKIPDDKFTAVLDAALLSFPLTIRTWQQGDSFYPLGMKTKKKLSDFFISLKIPVHQKTNIPLLINANGDIIWVCGYRISDRYKITSSTKKIYIFGLTEL